MQRTTALIAICLVLLLAVTGCSKFLDKEPDNRAQLNSPQKVSQLLGTAYPQANYQLMAELASDNTADLVTNELDVPDWTKLDEDIYFYRDNKGSGTNEDTPEGYWFGCYKAIAAANLALETIANAPNKDAYSAQKGEALVARAYAHFMLVNFYSKFYNAATAESDPGIPYVTEPEKVSVKQYERKTVKYVYDMVEKDLMEGLPLLVDNSYSVPKFHFTKAAANAFASRYYLYKKDYPNVIKYALAAVPENNFASNLRPWNTVYNTLPLNGNGSLGQTYSSATQNANLLLVETPSWWVRILGLGRYSASPEVVRRATSTEPVTDAPWAFSAASFVTGHLFIPKLNEYFVETSIGSGIGNGWQMVSLFTVEEVLFNLAEAYTYTNQTDKAIALLNTYLSTRIDSYNPSTDALTAANITAAVGTGLQQALIQVLLYYRRIEFIHEGLRWFDVLRYEIEVTHTQIDGLGNVLQTVKLTKDDPRRVFQLPPTTAESGLAPNPR